ncbi:MAG: hypothetical protein ACU0DT_08730 [Albimonas sp.]|uniref:hypothetical protein n=1 Tax=Albimonas sp. TaxID=1872425 RepID=UPI0040567D0B
MLPPDTPEPEAPLLLGQDETFVLGHLARRADGVSRPSAQTLRLRALVKSGALLRLASRIERPDEAEHSASLHHTLYRDAADGRLWESWRFQPHLQGEGPMSLIVVTEAYAAARYGPPPWPASAGEAADAAPQDEP